MSIDWTRCLHCCGPVEDSRRDCPSCEAQRAELAGARLALCEAAVTLVRQGLVHGDSFVKAVHRFEQAQGAYLRSSCSREERAPVVAPDHDEHWEGRGHAE